MDIIIENISKRYGKQQVLQDVSMRIEVGSCVAITGKNGCGKTTLLSILTGIEKADRGRVVFPDKAFEIGYLPQINPLIEGLSVEDNLKLWTKNKSRITNVLESFGLSDIRKKRVGKLSGGMKRRTAIICALVNEPELLIMDEPTASLDILNKQLLHRVIEDFRAKGKTVIMVTHEKEEMEMCNHIFYIENGKVV